MEHFPIVMLTIAIFIVVVAAGIAAVVIGSAAAVQRIERNSLKALTTRLRQGELTTDEFSLLVADRVLSQLPHDAAVHPD